MAGVALPPSSPLQRSQRRRRVGIGVRSKVRYGQGHNPGNSSLSWFLQVTVALLLLWAISSAGAAAAQLVNVTIERDDAGIVYFPIGEWREQWPGVRTSGSRGANATFNFTGTAVYYQGWRWTAQTVLLAQVDALPPVQLDITDYAQLQNPDSAEPAAESSSDADDVDITPTTNVILLISENLNGSVLHTVRILRPEWSRETVVGSFLYSTDRPPTTSIAPAPGTPSLTSARDSDSSSDSESSSSSDDSNTSDSPSRKSIYPAILGILSVLAIPLILIALWLYRRQNRARVERDLRRVGAATPLQTRRVLLGLGNTGKRPRRADTPHRKLDLEPYIAITTPLDKGEASAKWEIDS